MSVADEDLAAYQLAVANAPFDPLALRQLAVTYLTLNRPTDAVPLFVRALAEESNPSDHINLIYARSQAAFQILDRKSQQADPS